MQVRQLGTHIGEFLLRELARLVAMRTRTPLSRTIVAMTIASTGQPTSPSTTQATSAMVTAANNR